MASELGVQTIQHTNGTDALTIGSDGAVYPKGLTYWPHCSVYKTGNQTAAGANEVVTWNNVTNNPNSDFNTSTNKYVAPINGIYSLTINALTSSDSEEHNYAIFVNSTQYGRVRSPVLAGHISMTMVQSLVLTAGDEVYMTIVDTGSDLYGDADKWSVFSIVYIGG